MLVALALATTVAGSARAGPILVRLDRWEGKAVFAGNRGPGQSFYELVAGVSWARRAPREPGRYATQLVLPGGQVATRPLPPEQAPGSGRLTFLVPAEAVRDLRPEAVILRATVVDASTGAAASNALDAGIAQFPSPSAPGADSGPFGWGVPLAGPPGVARPLPRPGPDGLAFVYVPPIETGAGVFLSETEATVGQVKARLEGYAPNAGRSDEFSLDDPDQPAVNLTPAKAESYLKALGRADRSGLSYRLPTREEWLRAARAGRKAPFWWGDAPTYPAGANLLGPEPALAADSTAPARPSGAEADFRPNPWGLYHSFGNVAEWATDPSGGFLRMGGHFRTEPASPLPDVKVEGPDAVGPDPYVGVRPAFALDAKRGAESIVRALKGVPGLGRVRVAFDPGRATATLTGEVADASTRRRADDRLQGLWFLAAVEDRIESPGIAPGQLARLGPAGAPKRIAPLGRWLDEVPIAVRWSDPLPVEGSTWYVNVYRAGGGQSAHALIDPRPWEGRVIHALVDPRAGGSASVALSLGAPAPTTDDPRIVSNVVSLGPSGP